MVHGTNSPFRDAEKRSAIQNEARISLFLQEQFSIESPFYAHHPDRRRT
ncbi:hypothetical protein BURMUCF1_2546 [Burkholderia multivorans ATCC BAA-247]|uniref:Uncharacterized protein n=1 Tax=Burkholderia multivorans CGD2 TaxID=513052 RepID=B9BR79_9BURK|nr:hypothetical protein BURMUCGD2_0939 [Burkholderia multivorans CGD2]EEE12932.1 hypothetical protein BURMUCGD2M_1030 [Burkholderia multivorans CGD2M]EJO58992.1 hypothetical protein BURMUCF1_2546 [Burkholderia multivorans ATCC BAA-247]